MKSKPKFKVGDRITGTLLAGELASGEIIDINKFNRGYLIMWDGHDSTWQWWRNIDKIDSACVLYDSPEGVWMRL